MGKSSKAKESTEVTNSELVLPPHTNHYGNIFGGALVSFMDITGGLAAMLFCNEEVVTASIEALDFKTPIKQGDIIEQKGKVIYTGKTSMVVSVKVYRIEKFTGKKEFCCEGYFVYVAIDEKGNPKSIPALKIPTEVDKENWEIGRLIKNRALSRQERPSAKTKEF
jgi:acyl-CoA hydrolase